MTVPIPEFTFDLGPPWQLDSELLRQDPGLLHAFFKNSQNRSTSIEVREEFIRESTIREVLEAAKGRFAVDEIYDVQIGDDNNWGTQSFRVAGFLVMQAALLFSIAGERDTQVRILFQLAGPPEEFDGSRGDFEHAVRSVALVNA